MSIAGKNAFASVLPHILEKALAPQRKEIVGSVSSSVGFGLLSSSPPLLWGAAPFPPPWGSVC